jgi:hypothetical protein
MSCDGMDGEDGKKETEKRESCGKNEDGRTETGV